MWIDVTENTCPCLRAASNDSRVCKELLVGKQTTDLTAVIKSFTQTFHDLPCPFFCTRVEGVDMPFAAHFISVDVFGDERISVDGEIAVVGVEI